MRVESRRLVRTYFDNCHLTWAGNAFGIVQKTVYDIEDRPLWVTDANGVTVTNTYDDLGRLRTRTYPDGGVEKFGYSARGLVAYTNQLSLTNFYAYDPAGRRTFETNANNELIRYTNNAAGDLLSLTDGKNQTTRWNYDAYGRVTNKLDQGGAEILRYTYDPNSRLTNRWSAAKGNTKYAYDPFGNLTNIDYAVSTDVRFQYDALNRVTTIVDAAGTTKYAYTAGNQLLTEDGPFSSDTLTNTYTHRLRTSLSLQQSTGVWTNRFGYDTAKRLTNVTSSAGAFNYTYHATRLPLPIKLALPNSAYVTNTYDTVARLTGTYLKNSSHSVLDSYVYAYNPANQRTNLTRSDASTVAFAYDKIGQLKVADSSVSTEDRGYLYDAAWNLNIRTNGGVTTTFSVDVKNQLTNGPAGAYASDSNGNLASAGGSGGQTFEYDDENRLTTITSGTSYKTAFVYDGLGRLRKRTEYTWTGSSWYPDAPVEYVYDGWRVIQERNYQYVAYTRGNDLSGSLEGAGGIGGLLARSHGYSGGNWATNNCYFADGNWNVVRLVDSSQAVVASYRYDPYGRAISTSGSLAAANVYRFSSKELHVRSGVYYYGYRFYEPNLQRWLNRDPVDEIGFRELCLIHLPFTGEGEANLYRFVRNAPSGEHDPFGLLVPGGLTGGGRKCKAEERQGCDENCERDYGKGWKAQICFVIILKCQIGPLEAGVETTVCRCWKLN